MNGHEKERRYRLYRFDERLIMTVLGQWRHHETIRLPRPLDLPYGWEIHGVDYQLSLGGFCLLVWAPDFPIVPLGQHAPASPELLAFEEVVLLKRGTRVEDATDLIAELRKEEGHCVTLNSSNADFNGQPNEVVDVVGDWTGWTPRRFGGETLVEALRSAVQAKRAHESGGGA